MLRLIHNLQKRPKEERAFIALALSVVITFFVVFSWIGAFRSESRAVAETQNDQLGDSYIVEEHPRTIDLSPFYILKKEFLSLVGLAKSELSKLSGKISE